MATSMCEFFKTRLTLSHKWAQNESHTRRFLFRRSLPTLDQTVFNHSFTSDLSIHPLAWVRTCMPRGSTKSFGRVFCSNTTQGKVLFHFLGRLASLWSDLFRDQLSWLTLFFPFKSTIEFAGMSKVRSAFPISESSYLYFFCSAIIKAWNFWSFSSKFSGSFCEIVVLRQIDKSCRSMKWWHQCSPVKMCRQPAILPPSTKYLPPTTHL